METVLRLLRRVPLPPGKDAVQGADESQLAVIAARVDRPLPDDYVTWLRACNGSFAGPGGLFGARTVAGLPDAVDILGMYSEWAGRGWIPVAGDGCGNYYVLDISREHIDRDAVYFVDTMEDDGLTYIVATSLPRFLTFLLEKELGERGWPFGAGYVTATDPDITAVEDLNLLPWYG